MGSGSSASENEDTDDTKVVPKEKKRVSASIRSNNRPRMSPAIRPTNSPSKKQTTTNNDQQNGDAQEKSKTVSYIYNNY